MHEPLTDWLVCPTCYGDLVRWIVERAGAHVESGRVPRQVGLEHAALQVVDPGPLRQERPVDYRVTGKIAKLKKDHWISRRL